MFILSDILINFYFKVKNNKEVSYLCNKQYISELFHQADISRKLA